RGWAEGLGERESIELELAGTGRPDVLVRIALCEGNGLRDALVQERDDPGRCTRGREQAAEDENERGDGTKPGGGGHGPLRTVPTSPDLRGPPRSGTPDLPPN